MLVVVWLLISGWHKVAFGDLCDVCDKWDGPCLLSCLPMAKQVGALKLVGRVENFCCYKMSGAYFIRMQSSLTGKRFWKEKAFEGSRRSCRWLEMASSLASRHYRRLPREKKGREVFRALTGKVKRLLSKGSGRRRLRLGLG